ncbi:hypothetical protein R3P38DRAFT_3221873 [Favolaschia claudopus]|uniref:Uncharacterized protein n=1 Tax=Favolaschia claudopus TaxID=2862362 RepID=A0AAW0A085_9AGAR
MSFLETPPNPFGPAEDKALKLEAIQNLGKPATGRLREWLDFYQRGIQPPTAARATVPDSDYHKARGHAAQIAVKKLRLQLNDQAKCTSTRRRHRNSTKSLGHSAHKENIEKRIEKRAGKGHGAGVGKASTVAYLPVQCRGVVFAYVN